MGTKRLPYGLLSTPAVSSLHATDASVLLSKAGKTSACDTKRGYKDPVKSKSAQNTSHFLKCSWFLHVQDHFDLGVVSPNFATGVVNVVTILTDFDAADNKAEES